MYDFDKKKLTLFQISKKNKNHAKGVWTILKPDLSLKKSQ